MSAGFNNDRFVSGELAARTVEGFSDYPVPPMHVPVMVTRTTQCICGRHQLLDLIGYPLPSGNGWDSRYFRKVLPGELKDEPRRIDVPRVLEPA